jgi:hypothetical protein
MNERQILACFAILLSADPEKLPGCAQFRPDRGLRNDVAFAR